MDLKRYSRQIIIENFGIEGQYELFESKVLIIGLGGLGSPASIYLTLAGVGTLGLMDFDKVDLSNLQRQPLYSESDIGKYKVIAAKENLLKYNSNLKIEIYNEPFTYEKKEIVKNYDLILDCTDNLITRKIINQVSLEMGIPFLYCSLDQFTFQMALLNYNGGPCLECVFPNLENSNLMNCMERGILGTVSGIAGVYQAMEAVKVLTKIENISDEFLYYDVLHHKNLKLKIQKDPKCRCNEFKTKSNFRKKNSIQLPSINLDQISKLNDYFIIDIRKENKNLNLLFHQKKIKKIDLKELTEYIDQIPKEENIIVICDSGIRAKQVAKILKELDFPNVYYLEYDPILEK